jgi:putative copper export protein
METCALTLARCCVLLPALALFGSACFSLYAAAELRGAASLPLRVGLPMLAAIGALAWIVLLGQQLEGVSGLPSLATLRLICFKTGFGRALALAVVFSLGLAAAVAAGGASGLRIALSAALLFCLARVGHAAAAPGLSGEITKSVMAVHLLAAGLWLGGLPPLARALRRQSPAMAGLLRRFGSIGLISVCAIVGTGLGAGLFIYHLAGGRLGPAYLTAILFKLGLVAALLLLAAVNRFRLTPLMAQDCDRAVVALRRTVLLEQAFGLGIIAAVALLGQMDPAA